MKRDMNWWCDRAWIKFGCWITAYLGFGVFGAILCYGMQGRTIETNDWVVCAIILAIIAFVLILIPENIIKKKDNDYFFKTNGYYDRFLK